MRQYSTLWLKMTLHTPRVAFLGLVVKNKAPAEYNPGAAASDLTSCWHGPQQNMKQSAQKHIFIR